jgi:hypothetical protein
MQLFDSQDFGLMDGGAVFQKGRFFHHITFGVNEDNVKHIDEVLNKQYDLLKLNLAPQRNAEFICD